MDHYGASSSLAPEFFGAAEAMWQMNFRSSESMESGPYPERLGEPHCAYYARTGVCGFGMTCRYHHPPNRELAVVSPARINVGYPERVEQPECQAVVSPARINGGYPERVGQPECQYYLTTGTCKFGATCKFHHPRDKAGIAERVQSNILGYPLRPNEKECAYYLRTGQCKFGNTCKFDHPQGPQPSNTMVTPRGSNDYTPVHSPAGQQSYTGGWTNWPLSRTFFSSSRCQGTPFIIPQGLFQIPGYNAFSGQLESASSIESPQQSPGNTQSYGTSRQNDIASEAQGSNSSYQSVSVPMSQYALQRENVFPKRPDQPECQFYMKTGDCKYGAVCKFHHPQERMVPIPNCVLSPMGLPLRPGDPVCSFYSQYRICKFGPNCKYDHPTATPVGGFAHSLSTSSSPDIPVVRHLQGSSSGLPALTLSSEGPTKGKSRRLSLSEPRKMDVSAAGDDENIDAEESRAASSIRKPSFH